MLSADSLCLVVAVFVHAFDLQENAFSWIMGPHQPQNLRPDTGTPLGFLHCQIVQQDMVFPVDGNDQTRKFSVPGKAPYIAGTLEEHFHNHPERLFLRSRESFLVQFIDIRPLKQSFGRGILQQINQLLGPYSNSREEKSQQAQNPLTFCCCFGKIF